MWVAIDQDFGVSTRANEIEPRIGATSARHQQFVHRFSFSRSEFIHNPLDYFSAPKKVDKHSSAQVCSDRFRASPTRISTVQVLNPRPIRVRRLPRDVQMRCHRQGFAIRWRSLQTPSTSCTDQSMREVVAIVNTSVTKRVLELTKQGTELLSISGIV